MVDAELGTKRTCPSCGARFYDFGKLPIVCPSCEESFIIEAILPSKNDQATPVPVAKPAEAADDSAAQSDDVEIVSLEDAEAPDTEGDDETAGIEDVDLGDDDVLGDEDDDTFLEEDEDDGANVSDIVTGKSDKEDEV